MDRANSGKQGRIFYGLRVGPYQTLPGGPLQRIDLPECTERDIPPVSDKVVSLEDVREMGLQIAQYASNFPPKRSSWKIVILIGPNCPQAMQLTTMNVSEENQGLIVARTPLGWTLTGPKPIMYPKRNHAWTRHCANDNEKTAKLTRNENEQSRTGSFNSNGKRKPTCFADVCTCLNCVPLDLHFLKTRVHVRTVSNMDLPS